MQPMVGQEPTAASRPGAGVTTAASLYYFALVTKALVLSGGGSVGIAWEIGVAAGLARAGVDVRDADFITGTSAGSAVGAQLALHRDLGELVSRQRQCQRPQLVEPGELPSGFRMVLPALF